MSILPLSSGGLVLFIVSAAPNKVEVEATSVHLTVVVDAKLSFPALAAIAINRPNGKKTKEVIVADMSRSFLCS